MYTNGVIEKVPEAYGMHYVVLRHSTSYYVMLEWSGVRVIVGENGVS